MYKSVVLKYISYLRPEHVKNYAIEHHILVNDDEVIIIYKFIKEHYKDLLESDASLIELKPKIRDDLYETICNLYKENKAKYLS